MRRKVKFRGNVPVFFVAEDWEYHLGGRGGPQNWPGLKLFLLRQHQTIPGETDDFARASAKEDIVFRESLTADDGQSRTRRTNIFFLKTHKCASSTVQNILMRMGSKHGLTFVLPSTGNYLGNPKPFTPALIGPTLVTPDRKYNIFTHHTRYNVTAMREVMYQDAPFVTIMREPVSLFESLYSYYGMSGFYNMNLTQFLRKPLVEIETLPRYARKIGVNQMSWDLGLDQDLFRSEAAMEHLIHKVEAEFQLVMVAEFMEVSLVLLKDLMGWDQEDITFLTLNARVQGSKVNLTLWERDRLTESGKPFRKNHPSSPDRDSSLDLPVLSSRAQLDKRVNSADVLLYEHFNARFRARVKDFGDDRMRREVSTLLDKNSELYERCIKSVTLPVDPGKAYNNFNDWHSVSSSKEISTLVRYVEPSRHVCSRYVLNDNLGELDYVCNHITLAELTFTEQLRTRQAEKMRVLSKIEGFLAWDPPGAI
uniref:(California timema) hypothetical protein n=1 Tax=Timema californicum TaxID=61474 RepID=A0A7R9J990_TIMCA|nr:unnamed protein product [Timema californicum]